MPNARLFLTAEYAHPDHALLVHQGGQFYAWDRTCWPPIEDSALRSLIYRWGEHRFYLSNAEWKPFAPTNNKVSEIVGALRAISFLPSTIASPSWLGRAAGAIPAREVIACSNGLVHWPTRNVFAHTPTYYTHHAVPFAFDAFAPPPTRWLRFLAQLWGDDVESIETLQEMFGYLVSGDTSLQKMFLLIGPKRSGKGTIARVIRGLLGEHNVAGPTLASLGTNFGLQPLIGKPVAVIADARLSSKSDSSIVTERLLSISGEDALTIDRKHVEPWTGQLGTRVVVLTNELPRFSDSSGALASRFIMMRMSVSFFGRENPALTDELIAELPSIFNWALDGLARLRARGRLRQPQSSLEQLAALEDLASPISAFLRECCTLSPEASTPCDKLYPVWTTWCARKGIRASSEGSFGQKLRAATTNVQRVQVRTGAERKWHYQGVGLS